MQAQSSSADPRSRQLLETVIADHGSAVRSLLEVLERDPVAREDLWSEVFVVVIARADVLLGLTDGQARGWLLQATRHVTANHIRRTLRRRAFESDLADRGTDSAPSAEEVLLQNSGVSADDICRALRSLDESERAVLALQADGLRGPAIATALGVTPTAARSRLMRARRSLRDALETEGSR